MGNKTCPKKIKVLKVSCQMRPLIRILIRNLNNLGSLCSLSAALQGDSRRRKKFKGCPATGQSVLRLHDGIAASFPSPSQLSTPSPAVSRCVHLPLIPTNYLFFHKVPLINTTHCPAVLYFSVAVGQNLFIGWAHDSDRTG